MSKSRVLAVGGVLAAVSIRIGAQIGNRDWLAWVFLIVIPVVLAGAAILLLRATSADEIASKVEDLTKRVAALEANAGVHRKESAK
jgi:hypothetical protein